MLTSAAIIAGMCAGSICLAALAAKAADDTTPTRRNLVTTQAMDANRPGAGEPVAAGTDFLLKVDGIKGESAAASGGEGAAKKRRTLSDIPIVKKIDKSSPVLADSPPPPPQTRQLTVIQEINPPPPGQQRFQDVPPGSPYQPSGAGNSPPAQQRFQDVPPGSPYQPSGAGNTALTKASGATNPGGTQGDGHEDHIEIHSLQLGATPGGAAFEPAFQGGVRVAVGDVNAPAAALTGDDTQSSSSAGRRTYEPVQFKKRVDSATPGAIRPTLGSLQSVGSVGNLFLNSRGGDQAPAPGADGKLRLGTNAATSGAGGSPGGCAAACTNNLNTGKPAVPGAVPIEQFSMNYAKVGQGVSASPGGLAPSGAPVLQLNHVKAAAGAGTGTTGTPQVNVFQGSTGVISKAAGGRAAPNLVRTR